jgi:hypothetical protein
MGLQGRLLAGRYELGPRLGTGGMASVYQATDRVLDRAVAVKVLGPPYDRDPDFVERFRHEARMAAGLSHPGVVAIFDSASEAGLHYIVMEYVQGLTLADLLRRHGTLPPGLAAEVARQVCLALEAAHARGLVHRDIKPANVMVDQAGLVKVMDFGIAKAATTTTTPGGGPLLGTAPYLSPEQAQGRPVDERSDLYALGCVLYELLTGSPPFPGDSPLAVVARQVSQPPEPPSRRNPEVGAELDAVVMTALAKQPAQRYQTAAAMGQDLARVVRDSGGGVPLWPQLADPVTDPTGSRVSPSASASTAVIAARAVRSGARRLGRTRWALLAGAVLVVGVAVWSLRDGGSGTVQPQAVPGTTAPSTPTTASAQTTTTATTRPQPSVSVAMANLTQVVTTGQRQGTIDQAGEDLLHQAEEVVRAVQDGHENGTRKRVRELEHKAEELIRDGSISPQAAGAVRQAVAQFADAVQRSD